MTRIPVLALLSLLIAGCATGGRPEPAARSNDPRLVVNRTWEWVATVTPIEKTTVPNPERYTIASLGSELDRKLISLTGTIRFLAHECGFHAVEGENGTI